MSKIAHKQCWQCSRVVMRPGSENALCPALLESLIGDAKTHPMMLTIGIPVNPNADVTDYPCDFDLTMAAFRELRGQDFVVPYAPIEMYERMAREDGEPDDGDETTGKPHMPPAQKDWEGHYGLR
ncbi:hypothetical protein DFW101_3560 [Solidesulfovibrio carbinoliphilus subsp. oakridgensis]|uniref:Uncharacterized protein n=1 Tax=Solidesulfovibrio carbinoliphilus subsp. oakridgensis TaxID=694327 RepID=G7Q5J7_9BACT|nr:hypothetical protein [Solidesulfovibrio carbinoliphilus]EHJ49556.1 hypothetical protein DFW101_3560 [Solidesulfovibrio carbinoliphilus subsp. oakridgensis]